MSRRPLVVAATLVAALVALVIAPSPEVSNRKYEVTSGVDVVRRFVALPKLFVGRPASTYASATGVN